MKILIVGTNFNTPGNLKTQGQFLHELLLKNNFDCAITSKHNSFVLRTFDSIISIIKLPKKSTVILQVYSTLSLYNIALVAFLSHIKGLKIISTLHGGNIPYVYQTSKIKRAILTYIFNKSTYITAPSSYIKEQIDLLKTSSSFKVIHNIIHFNTYQNKPKSKDHIRIFWMRSYHPNYNPLQAIQIVELLKKNGVHTTLIMAGKDYGIKKDLISYVHAHALQDDIQILDVINDQTKNQIASESNLYLCTNIVDNAPVTFLEMMAMGLPIVSTNVGGIPYFVQNKINAFLSTDNSTENLASLIVELFNNNETYNNLVANGHEYLKQYSESAIINAWTNLLNSDN